MLFLDEMIDKANRKNEFVRESVYDVAKGKNYTALDVQDQLDKKITFGQRIADDVARFGGHGHLSFRLLFLWQFGWR